MRSTAPCAVSRSRRPRAGSQRRSDPCRQVRRLLRPLVALGAASASLLSPAGAASFPPVRGAGGAVAAAEPLAVAAGLEILGAGGNAADAAVAIALALAVVFPEAGNLAGGGFAVVRPSGPDGEPAFLDFRETAPGAATRDMFLGPDGDPDPELSFFGGLAVGVPGSPAGLWELLERHGRLTPAQVAAPAIRLARDGFVLSDRTHRELVAERELLVRFEAAGAAWTKDGEPLATGALVRRPQLAETLAAWAERGPAVLHDGPAAEALLAAIRRHGGVMTADDLRGYRPVWREPLRFRSFGWEMASTGLPSSGGFLVAGTLGLLERLGWAEEPRFGAERAHLLVEALRRTYADRFLLGDPETTSAGLADLLAPRRLDALAASISRDRAAVSERTRPGEGLGPEPTETTHLTVVDAEGGAVSLTTTLNGSFGSGLWVDEVGFLNNQMDDFAAAPGRPNFYGLIQGEANAVRPGRRMLSSMSPLVAWRPDDPGDPEVLALGGRGGSRIPTAVLQVLLAVLVDGDDLQAALDRPRIHHQWLPDELAHEVGSLAPETRSVLEARGHRLEPLEAVGQANAVRRAATGRFEAAGDPRGPGAAGVVQPHGAPLAAEETGRPARLLVGATGGSRAKPSEDGHRR